MTTHSINIFGVNLELLRKNKNTLIYALEELKKKGKTITDEKGNEMELNDLNGIIHLIDHVQEQAVSQLGLDPEDVFHFPEEDEDEG